MHVLALSVHEEALHDAAHRVRIARPKLYVFALKVRQETLRRLDHFLAGDLFPACYVLCVFLRDLRIVFCYHSSYLQGSGKRLLMYSPALPLAKLSSVVDI